MGLKRLLRHIPMPQAKSILPEIMLSDALLIKISSSSLKEDTIKNS
jgi:hypothetical protein